MDETEQLRSLVVPREQLLEQQEVLQVVRRAQGALQMLYQRLWV